MEPEAIVERLTEVRGIGTSKLAVTSAPCANRACPTAAIPGPNPRR